MSIFIDAVSIYCDNCEAKVELDTNIVLDTVKQNITDNLNTNSAVEMWALNAKEEFGYPHDTVCPTCADEIEEKLWPEPSAHEMVKALRGV